MGLFSCCIRSEVNECGSSDTATKGRVAIRRFGAPQQASSVDLGPSRANAEALTQTHTRKVYESNSNVNEEHKKTQVDTKPTSQHWRSGLECALALQALLCRTSALPETRAGTIVNLILNHLRASTVRLYVLGSTQSGSGTDDGLNGPLVQLAAAADEATGAYEAAAPGATTTGGGAAGCLPARRDVYLCPRHEALGASSMLLRRALVGKVAVVHRCGPKPCRQPHHQSREVTSAANLDPKCPSADQTGIAGEATSGAHDSGSSVPSSCMQPELESLRRVSAHCCPDLDLCDADAVPQLPMYFAAVPLLYGTTVLGVLWIALSAEGDEGDGGGGAASAGADVATAAAAGGAAGRCSAALHSAAGGHGNDGNADLVSAVDLVSTTTTTLGHLSQSDMAAAPADTDTAAAAAPPPLTPPPAAPPPPSAQAMGPSGLMGCPAALELLSTSVSMCLGAGSIDSAHHRRLASWLYRLAGGATLAELIGDLCGMLVRHIQRRFLVDATAHAALVPSMESRVAFMLRPERVDGFLASARMTRPTQQLGLLTPSRLRMSSIPSAPTAANVMSSAMERSRSVTLAQATAGKRHKPTMAEQQHAHTTTTAAAAATVTNSSMEGTSPAGRPWSLTALRSTAPREVYMLDSSLPRSDMSFGIVSSNCAAAQAPSLSARAFRLSNTLLQALVLAAQQQQQGIGGNGKRAVVEVPLAVLEESGVGDLDEGAAAAAGVLPGLVVRDCARHVQDERQPSRDVCMLMMASAAAGAAAGGDCGGGGRNGAGGIMSLLTGGRSLASVPEPGAVPPLNACGNGCSSGGGAQSLVLLGMEAGDGAVLGVYLTFPTPTPQQLLEAMRDSCNTLMKEFLARLVRHRLRCLDLAAEWETLRAGVPGAYLSVSRSSVAAVVDPSNTAAAANAGASIVPSMYGGPQSTPANVGVVEAPRLLSDAMCPCTTEEGPMLVTSGAMARGVESPGSKSRAGSSTVPLVSTSGPTSGAVPGIAPGSGTTIAAAGARPGAGAGSAFNPGSGTIPRRLMSSQAAAAAVGGGLAAGRQSASQVAPLASHSSLLGGGRSRKGCMTLATAPVDEAGSLPYWLSRNRRSATTPFPISSTAPPRVAHSKPFLGSVDRGSEREARSSLLGGGGGMMESEGFGITARDLVVGSLQVSERRATEAECWMQEMNTGTQLGPTRAPATAPGLLTVHDLEETYESWGMRAHMGALVDSILSTTLRSSGVHCRLDEGGHHGAEVAAARVTEGLDELQLSAVLGQGASGVVLKGTLGCAPVAVKIMEMPDADAIVRGGSGLNLKLPQSADEEEDGSGGGGGGKSKLDGEQRVVLARRALLRNAMEVALMRSISHVNIVQAFGVYDNVIMERHEGRQGIISLRRINKANEPNAPDEVAAPGVPKSSPICTAIVMELCDRGSLADALHNRTFPALPLPPPHPSSSPAATAGVAMQYARYWRGIYMTLLEVALALRHLHSRRLVHRDVKPGNILLKSSPGDPRGWTCKMADFGFALVLDKMDLVSQDDGVQGHLGGACSTSLPKVLAGATCPPVAAPGPAPSHDWYTVQQHIGGTVTHMAPEAFRKGSNIDASVDIFSFGIIMWELCCCRGQRPYKELHLDAISAAVMAGARPLFPPGDHVPLSYRQLARSCWAQEPRRRPTAAELVIAIKGLLELTKA